MTKSRFAATAIATVFVLGTGAAPASAGGVPTIDTASIAELIAIANQNAEMLGVQSETLVKAAEELETLRAQYAEIQRTYGAITGARDQIVGLFSGDITPRRLANSLGALTNSGAVLNNRARARLGEIAEQYQVMEGREFFNSDEEDVRTRTYDLVSASGVASMVTAEENFSQAGEAMERYDAYRQEIAKASDMKASIDLNTRVQVENGMMLAALLQAVTADARSQAARSLLDMRGAEIVERVSGYFSKEE